MRRLPIVLVLLAGLAPGVSRAAVEAPRSALTLVVGANVDVIGSGDAIQEDVADGDVCDPGKQTAQNETSIAVNPDDPLNLVAGANDYRLYSSRGGRYDASGGVYRSTDGGATWTVSLLPGLVHMNADAAGPYGVAGDPAISAGPGGTFWYANIAFDRGYARSAIMASRSTDGGATWSTFTVIAGGDEILHDKVWVAADPHDPDVAYVTWTPFVGATAPVPIVISKTIDGGATWLPPRPVAPYVGQGSVVAVDELGLVHVVYGGLPGTVIHAVSADGGLTFAARPIALVSGIHLPGATFRYNSFPALAIDGSTLHLVWADDNDGATDILYMRSTTNGLVWEDPVAISSGTGQQWMPWIGARDGVVFAGWHTRATSDDRYHYAAAGSTDGGVTWTLQTRVTTAISNAARGNRFPGGCGTFIGDYSGMAVGSDGVAHPLWTDVRAGSSPADPASGADNDPYTAALSLA